MILCDTDIFIEALKNNPHTVSLLRKIGTDNIGLSSISVMELYFGAIDKKELKKIKSRLQLINILHVNQEISQKALQLIEQYSKSHSLRIPDALIAATSIYYQTTLLTNNQKDFRFIENIRLYRQAQQS